MDLFGITIPPTGKDGEIYEGTISFGLPSISSYEFLIEANGSIST